MRVAALAVLLALAAFALPAAHAQVTNPACAPIDIPNQPAVPDPVPPGGQAQVRVEVRNANQVAVDVTVAAEASAPGWQVAAPPPATIAGGQTGTFTFTVTATSSATTDMTLRIAATGVCQSQGLPCPGTVCNAGSANAQVLVPLEPERGFTLPGLDALNVAPEILIAGIVLIGLASAIPFAMRRKKTAIVATCPEPLKMLRAGRGTSFPIEIRNPSKEPASAQFEVGAVPEGWSAFMPLPEVQLAPRESRSLWLMVRAPEAARVGEGVDVELRLRDPKRAVELGHVRVRAEVQAEAEPTA